MIQAKKAFAAFALTGALALSMCPIAANSASATELAAAQSEVQVVEKYGDASYTYNKNGFISKVKGSVADPSYAVTYKYSGAKILSAKSKSSFDKGNVKAKYKNGRIYKVTYKWTGLPPITDTYTYKKGRVVKVTRKNAGNYLIKYSYDKKGRLSKVIQHFQITKYKSEVYSDTFVYDSKGYIVKDKQKYGRTATTVKYKNTYKNGILVKTQMTSFGGMEPLDITYKTISVPKKYAAKVKAQQKKIFVSYGKDQNPFFF